MSRWSGRVQVAILEQLGSRRGGDEVEIRYQPRIWLADGIHDMRQVAREMTLDETSVYRAVRGLVERGVLTAYTSLVPIAAYGRGPWKHGVLHLADGLYFEVPSGEQWQRRFIGYTAA